MRVALGVALVIVFLLIALTGFCVAQRWEG
jgi:hypothetical protein